MNHTKVSFLCVAVAVLTTAALLGGCASSITTEKTGICVSNAIQGVEKTEYVFCVSKNSKSADRYLEEINRVVASIDGNRLAERYLSQENRRQDFLGELDVTDNTGNEFIVYSSVFSPYQFSGAYGNGVDGVDMYMMVKMADNLAMKPVFYDYSYEWAYNAVKEGKGDILATGVALTEKVKTDFFVSEVYSSGYQQILSDQAENYASLSDLKGKRIGVLSGRTGFSLISESLASGVLKNTGATVIEYDTDAEAFSDYRAEGCDALVLDEFSAKNAIK